MYRRPDTLITTRAIKIHGVSVPKATTLTKAQVDQLGSQLDRLVSKGVIAVAPDTYGRRGLTKHEPTYLQPALRPSTVLTAAVDGTVAKKRNFVAKPADAYVFDFGDGNNAVADADGTISHTYAAAGVYDVVATAAYQSVALEVTVTNLAATPTLLSVAFTATPSAAGPFTFDFGDESELVVDADGVVTHVYDEAGTYTATATCADTTQVASVQVTVAEA